MQGPFLRATALLVAATVALGACANSSAPPKSPAASISTTAPGLTPDQRIVREAAHNITPVDPGNGNDFDWFTDNPEILLAGLGCVVGAVAGGSVGDCLAGAAVGGLTGAVARVTIFDDREKYSSDEEFVEGVSKELDRVLEENLVLVPAAERLVDSHEAQIVELNKQYAAGTLTAAAYRQQIENMLVDEKALELIAEANNQLSTDIDRSLTGANITSDLQMRIQDQEGQFLADSGRIQYALERVTAALATVPKAVLDA